MAKANGFWKLEDPTRILELIVCSELQRRRESLFYWHSEKGYEVDFITTRGTNPQVAIQVSYSLM
jgi:predicted AAA+ superfamily ATPase